MLMQSLATGIQVYILTVDKARGIMQTMCILGAVPSQLLRMQAGGGSEPLLQAGDSSFTSAKSVESFTSARSLPRETGEICGDTSA